VTAVAALLAAVIVALVVLTIIRARLETIDLQRQDEQL
jgi:hypothetical protein